MAVAQATGEKRRITAKEYAGMYPESTRPMELIDGEVVILPTPRPLHQMIIARLMIMIGQVVMSNDLGELQPSPSDVYLDEDLVLQPDIFFIEKGSPRCRINDDGWWQGAPDLCIEILSPGTAKRDRTLKFNRYAKYGVREYWIVDPEARYIEVYVLEGDFFRQVGGFDEQETFTSAVLPQLTVKVAEVFPKKEA